MRSVNAIGSVPKGSANKYWKYTLGSRTSGTKRVLVYALWLAHVGLIFIYSLLLLVYLKTRYDKSTPKQVIQPVIDCLPEFIDIYPTCVYPLVVKSTELTMFRQQPLSEPSLELGTGDGYFTSKLYKGRDYLTIASDLIGHTLVQAKKYGFYRQMVIIDSNQIPLPDNSLQTVIMNNLIHHLPDRSEILKEVWRVLKPGGRFIVTDEYTGWATSQWHIKIWKLLSKASYDSNVNRFLGKSVQCLLDNKAFWVEQNRTGDWELFCVKDFFSNEGMFWSSILETLNRKLGSPTPKPIRNILDNLPVLKKAQVWLTKGIATELIAKDVSMIKKSGATSVFVVLEKKDMVATETVKAPFLDLVCPKCKDRLYDHFGKSYCLTCRKEYPLFNNDIPFMIAYRDELPDGVLDDTKDKTVPDVSC
jgi:SAM-dependent methyltransferase/uncharacterized protein YbaR (Trm112 family)